MKYTPTTQGIIDARRPKVAGFLPKTIESGTVLMTTEHVHMLAMALGEEIGPNSYVTELDVARGKYDSDPLLREWTLPALSPRKAEQKAREERNELLRNTPLALLEECDLFAAMNLSEYDEDQTFHLSAKRALEARITATEERTRRANEISRLEALDAVTNNPQLMQEQADKEDWDGCRTSLLGYATTEHSTSLARVLSDVWVDRKTRFMIDAAQKKVKAFLASNPPLWGEI
jgi:hypothetical protein